jgi:hypothetical protein
MRGQTFVHGEIKRLPSGLYQAACYPLARLGNPGPCIMSCAMHSPGDADAWLRARMAQYADYWGQPPAADPDTYTSLSASDLLADRLADAAEAAR